MMTDLLAAFAGPWAITPAMLSALQAYAREPSRVAAMPRPRPPVRDGSVAVLALHGVIHQRPHGVFDALVGGTSTEVFGDALRQYVADPSCRTIVIDCDTPGGRVEGVQELADLIFQARGRKPIIAVANSQLLSAGYWIASQASEIVASPSAQIGSIGVLVAHQDVSKATQKAGVTMTVISTPRFKAEGNPFEPLSPEGRDYLTQVVGDTYRQFVATVARGRGVPASRVASGYGQGRALLAGDAIAAGMADRRGTLGDVLARRRGGVATAGRNARFAGTKARRDRAFLLEVRR